MHDLSYEIFVRSLESCSCISFPAVFIASRNTSGLNSGRGGGHHFRGGCGKGFRNNRYHPIRFQIYCVEGHYTSLCSDQYSRPLESIHSMEAFTSCSLNDSQISNWYTNACATSHMAHDATQLDKVDTYTGKDYVVVGNGASLSISHAGIFFSISLFKLITRCFSYAWTHQKSYIYH